MADRQHDAGCKIGGSKMNDYMQMLLNICFTMVTGVIIVGCFGAMIFLGLLIWQIVEVELG